MLLKFSTGNDSAGNNNRGKMGESRNQRILRTGGRSNCLK